MEDEIAYEENGGAINALVQEVIRAKRESAMPKAGQKDMKALVGKYARAGGSTFFIILTCLDP